jgi:glutathione S-transferase
MELYFSPLSCSFAARVVAHEAGIPLTLRQVEVYEKTLTATGASYLDIAPFGQVPALRLDDGSILTELPAVILYLAEPPPDDRHRVHEWLNFVGTELHKKILWPIYNRGIPDAVRAFARESAPAAFAHVARHLADREFLVGDRFTAADAYLVWALHMARLAGLDISPAPAAYLKRMRARPSVAALLAEETPLAVAAMARQPGAPIAGARA